jgi:hypothetical protein
VIAAIVIALAGATLVSPVWRRPAFVLVSTVAASAVVVAVVFNGVPLVSSYLLEQLPNPHLEYRLQIPWRAIDLAALFVPAIVCARLHGLLLTTPPANRDLT